MTTISDLKRDTTCLFGRIELVPSRGQGDPPWLKWVGMCSTCKQRHEYEFTCDPGDDLQGVGKIARPACPGPWAGQITRLALAVDPATRKQALKTLKDYRLALAEYRKPKAVPLFIANPRPSMFECGLPWLLNAHANVAGLPS